MDGEWITSFEAASLMGVGVGFIQDRCRKGYLKGKIVSNKGQGRLFVRRSEIEERLKRPPRYRWQSSSAADTHYVTFETAAEILGISWATLRKWMKDGKVQSVTHKPVPVEERVHNHRVYFRRHEVESLAKKLEPSEYTPAEWGYMAAMIDGEGSIGISGERNRREEHRNNGRRHTLQISLGNTCKEIIDWIHTRFGGTVVFMDRSDRDWADAYYWTLQGERAANVLRGILPYLVGKREQAILAIEFRDHVKTFNARGRHNRLRPEEIAWREEKRKQISDLNNRFLRASREARKASLKE